MEPTPSSPSPLTVLSLSLGSFLVTLALGGLYLWSLR